MKSKAYRNAVITFIISIVAYIAGLTASIYFASISGIGRHISEFLVIMAVCSLMIAVCTFSKILEERKDEKKIK